jgi:hypothetical protein
MAGPGAVGQAERQHGHRHREDAIGERLEAAGAAFRARMRVSFLFRHEMSGYNFEYRFKLGGRR